LGFAAVAMFALLNIQFSIAFADTHRVGVLTASYAITVTNDSGGCLNAAYYCSDSLNGSISGEVKYEMLQTETNLIVGNLLYSAGQESVSGSWFEQDMFPPYQSGNGPYLADPNFSPTNVCRITNAPTGSGQFLGTCEKIVWGVTNSQNTNFFYTIDDGWTSPLPDWWDWTDWSGSYHWAPGYWGDFCAVHGEELVRDFQFAITNATTHWSQTIQTNGTATDNYNDSSENDNGSALVSRTVTLEYIPDQPTIAGMIFRANVSGVDLMLNGSNGQSNTTYCVLMSTSLALPLSQWTPVATNCLNADGNFTITATNAVDLNAPQRFFILQVQ
jgi:hypothetical protein